MKNVTITLDEETALWIRIEAARRNTSVSRLVGEMLSEHRQSEKLSQAATERFFNRPTTALKRSKDRYPTRDSLYDRPVLR